MANKEHWLKVMKLKGGKVAEKVNRILLIDPQLEQLKPALDFISKTWFDPLTPAMISFGCEAVGGDPEEINDIAIALGLINLSINVWDELIDEDTTKLFKPTLLGEFGRATSLIVGGLAVAKANSILAQSNIPRTKYLEIDRRIWNLWTKMGIAETRDFKLRTKPQCKATERLQKLLDETVYLQTCLEVGAILGDGSKSEVEHLGNYGRQIGLILELSEDFRVSLNLTLELSRKLESGELPYSLLWASEQSDAVRNGLKNFEGKSAFKPADIQTITSLTLETKILSHIEGLIENASKQGIAELNLLKANSAKETLKKFVGDQPQLFMDSLRAIG